MAAHVFLGNPTPKIKEWIEKNYKPAFNSAPLCFTAEEAQSAMMMEKHGYAPPDVYLETSRTGEEGNWSDFVVGETVIMFENIGDKVYFRAKQDNQRFATQENVYHKFLTHGKIAASGNINTLLKADGSVLDLTGRDYCYANLFKECTSLTQAPELPATTLARDCYYSMFHSCKSLTQAPELPATTLADYCYTSMFLYCTNLNSINVNFSAWHHNATDSWLTQVSSSGTFTCPADLPEEFTYYGIPTGWTVVRK